MTDTLKQAEALVLLPCPFCGGVAELNHSHTIYPHIVCTSEACQACGPALYSAEAAIESWNTRADRAKRDAAPAGVVVVPMEPTEAMLKAGAHFMASSYDTVETACRYIYMSMITATQENDDGH